MKAVLFDLDDTLYPEMEFVKSGFRVVARYLSERYNLDEKVLFAQLLHILQTDGRGKVFDTLLVEQGLYTDDLVKLLVYLYHSHQPSIRVYEEVLPTLERLRHYGVHLGLVTDGMASVQRNKIRALGLEDSLDVIICTDEIGKDCWKPSTVPFKIALDLLRCSPSEAVYVGDDPSKDFLAPNSLAIFGRYCLFSLQIYLYLSTSLLLRNIVYFR